MFHKVNNSGVMLGQWHILGGRGAIALMFVRTNTYYLKIIENIFSIKQYLTNVSTLRCRKVSRNIEFDCKKSSVAFSVRFAKVVDQLAS